MPMVSQAQSRAMHAADEGHSTLGIPQSVGHEFVTASHGESVRSLPVRLSSSPDRRMAPIKLNPAHKGLFRRDVGKSPDQPITEADIQKGEHSSNPAERKRAVFAENARHFHHAGSSHMDPAYQPVDLMTEEALGHSFGRTASDGAAGTGQAFAGAGDPGASGSAAPHTLGSTPSPVPGRGPATAGGLPGATTLPASHDGSRDAGGAGGLELARDLADDDADDGGPMFGGTMHRAIHGLHRARHRGTQARSY